MKDFYIEYGKDLGASIEVNENISISFFARVYSIIKNR